MRGMHPPTSHFQKTFLMQAYTIFPYSRTFSITISLKHAQSKMCKLNASYLGKHSEFGSKNTNKICVKNFDETLAAGSPPLA